MPLNACELEIDLFCRGMRLPDDVSLAGARSVSRTRAGLGSGLEIAVPSRSMLKREIWVNVPVVERFARSSPYRLAGGPQEGYAIVDDRDTTRYPVRLPAAPAWYSRQTSRDVPMHRIGVLQGTYLAIYVNPVCAFWNADPRLNCKFCTTGQNVGAAEAATKTISDVVETCWAAKQESDVTFVHLNGGFQGTHGLEFIKPYVKAIKESVGLLVGVQLAPERDFTKYDELVALGVDHFSFCLELLDPDWFARVCPGKARVHGQSLYFDAMAHCARLLPHGAVAGEIIAGIEPMARTLEAIDRIVALGAFPTVCVFRPTVGADMESWPTPSYEEIRTVMRHMYDACRRHWLPIGVAPNIEVSLVVNPDDAALLAKRTAGFYVYEAYRRLARIAARPIFGRRMRAG
ncbi:MAG: hypothetical protein HY047_21430 [Acidobacteria bacterium]|nr:hypothetical protein [Acidobacteriota bacterium]